MVMASDISYMLKTKISLHKAHYCILDPRHQAVYWTSVSLPKILIIVLWPTQLAAQIRNLGVILGIFFSKSLSKSYIFHFINLFPNCTLLSKPIALVQGVAIFHLNYCSNPSKFKSIFTNPPTCL